MEEMENIGLNVTVDGSKKDAGEGRETNMTNIPLDETGLKEKYGKLYEIEVTVDEDDEKEGRRIRFLFKKPSAASFSRYVKGMSKDLVKSTDNFASDNIIEEQLEAFKQECDVYPALSLNMGQKLLNILGLSDNVNFRRL